MVRSHLLAPLMGAALLVLVFLGSPGCGCGDTWPTGGQEPAPCCCDFLWAVQVSPNLVDQDVRIDVLNATPGLGATVTPSVLTGVSGGDTVQFTVCVDVDHPLDASIDLEFRQVSNDTLWGSGRIEYPETCTPEVIPGARTVLWSPDCGEVPQCCCDYVWYPSPFTDGADVDIVVTYADSSLVPVVTPSILTNTEQGEAQQFSVCIEADHQLGELVILEFRDAGDATVYGSATLQYYDRCTPTILPGLRTDIYSPDCGTVPQCCCELAWLNTSTGAGPFDVRVEFADVDSGLNPTATPPLVADVGTMETAVFNICVDLNHAIGSRMTVNIVDNDTDQVLGSAYVLYGQRCLPTVDDTTGFGQFGFLCGEVLPQSLQGR